MSETATEPPQEEGSNLNSPKNLSLEATFVNHNFSQQVLKIVSQCYVFFWCICEKFSVCNCGLYGTWIGGEEIIWTCLAMTSVWHVDIILILYSGLVFMLAAT